MDFSIALSQLGQFEASLFSAREISDECNKSDALIAILLEHGKQMDLKSSASILQEALTIAREISDDYHKIRAYNAVAIKLNKQGYIEESKSVMHESFAIAGEMDDYLEHGDYFEDKCCALADIALALSKQGQLEESLSIARSIIDDDYVCIALLDISIELCQQGRVSESLKISRGTSYNGWYKSYALTAIAVELKEHGREEETASVLQESLDLARGLSDKSEKIRALNAIAAELNKKGKLVESSSVIQETITIARKISDNYECNRAFKEITVELSKISSWILVEKIGMEILQIGSRHEFWKSIATETVKNSAWHKALESRVLLNSQEAQLYYLKGWANAIEINDVNHVCVNKALPILADDTESIELLLQKYAAREVALGNPSKELISRLNRTLNIQWLLDITAQFAN
jgi:tetratricopeptide (TPR) repeat protein